MARKFASPWPAWVDLGTSLSGLLLVLFMWAHLFAVSSILLGKPAMHRVTKFFEGSLFFSEPQPWLVSVVALGISLLLLLHTLLALRKLPAGYREWRTWTTTMRGLKHTDTTLWLVQVVTGLVLMFFVGAHLLELFLHPGDIGPHASSAKIANGGWVLGLILLFAVEIHAGLGLYRIAVKWGAFGITDSKARRRRLRVAVYAMIVFFILLGLATQQAYLRIAREPAVQAGERYLPPDVGSAKPAVANGDPG